MRYLKITWRNTTDLGSIYYAGGYTNIMFLDVEVSKPEYPVEVEAEKDGENVSIPTFKKWQKAYKFELWATEDIVDAFTLMQIHDTITVTLQTGQQINVQNGGMTVGVEWMDGGCLAKLDVSFTEDYITGTNCDANLEDGCYCEGTPPQFWEIIANADFPAYIPQTVPIVMVYTVENILLKKYTAQLWQYSSGWVSLNPDQFDCWENVKDDRVYMFDGQFWQLFPGYVSELTQPGVSTDIVVKGYIPPGCFATVQFCTGGVMCVWDDYGDYTDDELAAGVTLTGLPAQTTDIRFKVWNHSCDYGETEIETIVIN